MALPWFPEEEKKPTKCEVDWMRGSQDNAKSTQTDRDYWLSGGMESARLSFLLQCISVATLEFESLWVEMEWNLLSILLRINLLSIKTSEDGILHHVFNNLISRARETGTEERKTSREEKGRRKSHQMKNKYKLLTYSRERNMNRGEQRCRLHTEIPLSSANPVVAKQP